nr:glycosyltransferase family 2 protein [Nitratidesulfovibrio sp. SRB-5]
MVVPVLHEGHRIAELAGHVRALAEELPPGAVELVVADGAPEGDTLAALKLALGEDAWRAVTGLGETSLGATGLAPVGPLATGGSAAEEFSGTGLPVRAVAAPRGRARQMNAGAAVARGEVLLFLHADTRLPGGAFPAVLRALGVGESAEFAGTAGIAGSGTAGEGAGRHADDGVSRSAVGIPAAGAFTLAIDAPGAWFRVVETLANLRNRLTRTPYGDQAQFFRAGLFRAMGGYTDMPLMEDVEIMRRLRRQHRLHGPRGPCGTAQPLALLDLRAVTSARRWRDEGAVRCTLRNVCLRLLYALGVPAQILARWYRARKGAS